MSSRKFVRSLTIATNASFATPFHLKLLYEFWGYVVNGASTPTAPATGAFPSSNPNNFPTNSLEGTSVQATGTNGSTTAGSSIFTSAGASFTTAMIGSVLVAWIPGSGSTDDSIYLITAVPSATTLQVVVANGGTPNVTTLQPTFTNRSSILYRVVNISGLSALSFATTDYIIFQLTPASSSNPNASQATSQVQCIMNSVEGGTTGLNMIGSPAGTWTGSAFTDAMAAVTTQTNVEGYDNGTPTNYTITGDLDGVWMIFKGLSGNGMSFIYFEAPTRVGTYPTNTSDQNPLILATDGLCGIALQGGGAGTILSNIYMAGSDGVSRRHVMQAKSVLGDGNQLNNLQPNNIISGDGINDVRLAYASDRGSTFVSPIMVGQTLTSTNFTRCRAILKQLYSCSAVVPLLHRLGTNGQYLHLENGICIVWDNTIMPIPLIPFGY